MNLTAWPGRGYLPDVGEAVATYWEKVGLKVKRRPVDRAVFAADFRARSYSGVALAYAGPDHRPGALGAVRAHRPDEVARCTCSWSTPSWTSSSTAWAPSRAAAERVRIMREEMGPWLYDYMPGRRHRGDARDRRRGAEGGGLAADPRPHGHPQLGVRDPGAVDRGQTACGGICSAGCCRRC